MFTKRKLYFTECHLAGRKYHEADEVWEQLKVGAQLSLIAEPDNRFDPYAVGVFFHAEDGEDHLLGYIPRGENKQLSAFLEMGWTDLFECRISKLDPEMHPENQVMLTIKIKRNAHSKGNAETS